MYATIEQTKQHIQENWKMLGGGVKVASSGIIITNIIIYIEEDKTLLRRDQNLYIVNFQQQQDYIR